MRGSFIAPVAVAAVALVSYFAICPTSAQNTSAVEAAMAGSGYESWGSITERPDSWEVAGARDSFSGGRKTVSLDKVTLRVRSTAPDHNYRMSSSGQRTHCFL